MFKLPIELLSESHKKNTTSACQNDLQLDVIFNDLLGEQEEQTPVRKIWLTNFTTDTQFLKDTQKLLQDDVTSIPNSKKIKEMLDVMKKKS